MAVAASRRRTHARGRTARVIASLVTLLSTTIAASALAPSASAAVVEPPRPAFYEAPATLPATNGAVIRSEIGRAHV